MANKAELGQAYITIIPTTRGMVTTIEADLKKAGQTGGKACGSAVEDGITSAANSGSIETAGENIGSKLSGGISKLMSAAVIAAAATAVADFTKEVVNAYADYEQLVGGIDTLFKTSSEQLQEYASQAYKTAGMSANSYMEMATSFSASLISSLGGDTEKAADYANKAIVQMSDNANKMGTDMELIQNAYRGFAKANFTMLDNLALGYAGTKEGMEQLLADASAISGIEYDVSSYADIVDAIGIIQDKMGITGTTAAEASDTITGSIASTKAAYENLLTAFALGTDETTAAIENLVGSFDDVLKNVIPIVERVFESIVEVLPQLLDSLIKRIIDYIPRFVEIVSKLAVSLVRALPDLVKTIVKNIPQIINSLVKAIIDCTPEIVKAGFDLMTSMFKELPKIIKTLCAALPTLIKSICDFLKSPENILEFVKAGIELAAAIVEGLWNALVELIKGAFSGIGALFEGLFSGSPTSTVASANSSYSNYASQNNIYYQEQLANSGQTFNIGTLTITANTGDELDYLLQQATAAAGSY